jgi:hypothetical protein
MKQKTVEITPFEGFKRVDFNGSEGYDFYEILSDMGYLFYIDPTDEDNMIMSDRVLTYGDLKNSRELGIDLKWWNKDTDFNSLLDKELEKF